MNEIKKEINPSENGDKEQEFMELKFIQQKIMNEGGNNSEWEETSKIIEAYQKREKNFEDARTELSLIESGKSSNYH